jgi:hypothetical protein
MIDRQARRGKARRRDFFDNTPTPAGSSVSGKRRRVADVDRSSGVSFERRSQAGPAALN